MFCRSFLNFKKLKKFSLNSNKISLKLFSVISFNFYEERTGDTIKVKAEIGKKVLDIALENNVDIEGLFLLYFLSLSLSYLSFFFLFLIIFLRCLWW